MSPPPPNRSDDSSSSTCSSTNVDSSEVEQSPDMSQSNQAGDDPADSARCEVHPRDVAASRSAQPRNTHPTSHPKLDDTAKRSESRMSNGFATREPHCVDSEDLMHCGTDGLPFPNGTQLEPGSELLSFAKEPVFQREGPASFCLKKTNHKAVWRLLAEQFNNTDGSHNERRPSRADSDLPSLVHTDGNSPSNSRTPTFHDREVAASPEILPISEGSLEQAPEQLRQNTIAATIAGEIGSYKVCGEDNYWDYLQHLRAPLLYSWMKHGSTDIPRTLREDDEWAPYDAEGKQPGADPEANESFEDDEWMSDSSETNDEIDDSNPFFELKDDLIQHVLFEYSKWRQTPTNQGSNSNNGGTSQSGGSAMANAPGKSSFSGAGPSKRPLPDDSDGQDNNGNNRPPPKKAYSNLRLPSNRNKLLACPFMKKDPFRHRDCYQYKITRIQDVKTHLYRCHTGHYCPRCLVFFDDEKQLVDHQRIDTACEVKEGPKPDGIMSPEQKARLKKRVNPKSSTVDTVEQWFSIFERLFPDIQRPSSPYLEGELALNFSHFIAWAETYGIGLMVCRVKSILCVNSGEPVEEQQLTPVLNSALSEGLRDMFDKWKEETATLGIPASARAPSLIDDNTLGESSITEGAVTAPASSTRGDTPCIFPHITGDGSTTTPDPEQEQSFKLLGTAPMIPQMQSSTYYSSTPLAGSKPAAPKTSTDTAGGAAVGPTSWLPFSDSMVSSGIPASDVQYPMQMPYDDESLSGYLEHTYTCSEGELEQMLGQQT